MPGGRRTRSCCRGYTRALSRGSGTPQVPCYVPRITYSNQLSRTPPARPWRDLVLPPYPPVSRHTCHRLWAPGSGSFGNLCGGYPHSPTAWRLGCVSVRERKSHNVDTIPGRPVLPQGTPIGALVEERRPTWSRRVPRALRLAPPPGPGAWLLCAPRVVYVARAHHQLFSYRDLPYPVGRSLDIGLYSLTTAPPTSLPTWPSITSRGPPSEVSVSE